MALLVLEGDIEIAHHTVALQRFDQVNPLLRFDPDAEFRRGVANSLRTGEAGQVFPVLVDLDELAVAIGRDLQPFVLLMAPQDPGGFFRHWVPEEMGPGKHFAYALQWFAMAAILAGMLIWNYRRRRTHSA
ncbi:MAG: hypothetical protein IIA07_00910 [Proteobacteria bacterium]|nr:hypothetical protein [Pseudomonadota bacterium]